MNGDRSMRDRTYLGADSGGENKWKRRLGVVETLG